MKNRFVPDNKERGDMNKYFRELLFYLESEDKFSHLFQREPSERLVKQYLEHTYRREFSEEDFISYYKETLERYNRRMEIKDRLMRYGSSRQEIISNLRKLVINTQKIFDSYRRFLMNETSLDSDNSSLYARIKAEELDARCLNALGGRN